MGYEHERLTILEKEFLEPEDGGHIEVVCGCREGKGPVPLRAPCQKNARFMPAERVWKMGVLIDRGPFDPPF